jgi:hypothetical protein
MANPNVARGLIPTRTLQGVPYSGQVQTFLATGASGAIYIGSPVKHGGSAASFNGQLYTTCAGSFTTGQVVIGVCVGIQPVTRESTLHRANSTDRLVHVCTDPFMLFEVQDSQDTDAAALLASEVGFVADLTSDAGSTVTGRSTVEVNGDSAVAIASSDQTEDVQIIEVVRRPDNAVGANAKYLVRLLNHYFTTDDSDA